MGPDVSGTAIAPPNSFISEPSRANQKCCTKQYLCPQLSISGLPISACGRFTPHPDRTSGHKGLAGLRGSFRSSLGVTDLRGRQDALLLRGKRIHKLGH